VVGLERALLQYVQEPSEVPFDIKTVPLVTTAAGEVSRTATDAAPSAAPGAKPGAVAASRQDVYAEQLSTVPELAHLGPLFKSSVKPAELTESETEYVVNCVKHTFGKHVVFQVRSLFELLFVVSWDCVFVV
jgi:coatomer protein complex subunit gamma